MAMSKASTEAMWLRKLLHEVDFSTPSTPPQSNLGIKIKPMLYADNQGAITLTENPVFHNKTKHIENRYHYIRERVAEGSITVKYISTDNMIADGLTFDGQWLPSDIPIDKAAIIEEWEKMGGLQRIVLQLQMFERGRHYRLISPCKTMQLRT